MFLIDLVILLLGSLMIYQGIRTDLKNKSEFTSVFLLLAGALIVSTALTLIIKHLIEYSQKI